MKFIKYPSLTNDYALNKQNNILQRLDDLWFTSEKLDGMNVSIIMNNEGTINEAKRSGVLKDENDFEQFKKFIEFNQKYGKDLFNKLMNIINDKDADQIQLYGEVFGKGIQKSKYNVNSVKFFSAIITIDDKDIVLSRKYLQHFIDDYLIPIETIRPLRELIDIDIENQNGKFGETFEGYVYLPYDEEIDLQLDHFPAVKHKTEKFSEVKKSKKSKKAISSSQLKLNLDVDRYVTENRIIHVISNNDIELIPQNIGKIIKLTQEDINKEYKHENNINDENQLKVALKSTSKNIANTIKQMIANDTKDLLNHK